LAGRIKIGDLVRFRHVTSGELFFLWNKFGVVVSKPKEKAYRSLHSESLVVVVDVLVDNQIFSDVNINILEKNNVNSSFLGVY
jgi:hypothetical protein